PGLSIWRPGKASVWNAYLTSLSTRCLPGWMRC
ncbi:hypothetical protein AZZ74_003153, partial [Klebsiella pneumoniae]